MPEITVYGPARIPFTMRVRGALALKKLDYSLVEPQSQEDYRRWNPATGLLPVIDIDGEKIPDSLRILDALDERFPEPPLLAEDPKAARSQLRLEQWVEAAFMFYWIHYLRVLVDGQDADPDVATADLSVEFGQRLDDLVNFLGGRTYYYDDEPSRADISVFSWLWSIGEAVEVEVAGEVAARPTLQAHLQRMAAQLGF